MTLYHQPTRDQIDLGIAILDVILVSIEQPILPPKNNFHMPVI